MSEILFSHPMWWIAASSGLFGLLVGTVRGGSTTRQAVTFDALVLFAAATLVCDAMRWMGWSSEWGVNPYALCLGFLLAAGLRTVIGKRTMRTA